MGVFACGLALQKPPQQFIGTREFLIVNDPHFQEREALIRCNGMLMQGLIAKLSLTPGSIHRAAPRAGEHTAEVLREAGLDSDR